MEFWMKNERPCIIPPLSSTVHTIILLNIQQGGRFIFEFWEPLYELTLLNILMNTVQYTG